MAHPRLTAYLLKLATDPDELERYNAAEKAEREELLEAHGLTPRQRGALLSADSERITEEVLLEVQGPAPAGGTHYTIQLALDIRPCKPA